MFIGIIMSIQFGNNIKVFITEHLDAEGAVILSGLTPLNTKQLIIEKDTLSVSQAKSYEYINSYSDIDSTNVIDKAVSSSLDTGTLGFRVGFNTSSTGPLDTLLWNGLVSFSSYPGDHWNLSNSAYKELNILRNTSSIIDFGIIICSDDLTYVFNSMRVSSAAVSVDMNTLLGTDWSCSFTSYELITDLTVTLSNNGLYNLTRGTPVGTIAKANPDNYSWASGRLSKLLVRKLDTIESNSLALTSASIQLSNNITYIEDKWMDRSTLSNNFVDAGSYSIDGTLNFYTRSAGSYANTLVKEILATLNNPTSFSKYTFTLEIYGSGSTKLCDIQLSPCLVSAATDFSNILTNSITFKVVDGAQLDNCFIKFYT